MPSDNAVMMYCFYGDPLTYAASLKLLKLKYHGNTYLELSIETVYRGLFRTMSNIYDGDIFQKYLTVIILQKS